MTNKICYIVGSHPETRDLVPWDADGVDFWLLNESGSKGWPGKIDALFQLHLSEIYRNATNVTDGGHWAWLQQEHGYPIYMQDVDPDVPDSVAYPIDEIRGELPHIDLIEDGLYSAVRHELTSTFPYAIALAIYQGYETIRIYGVEMASMTEYTYQREGLKFWLGIALGRGVNVEMASGHSMWSHLLYAYDGNEITLPVEHFEERLKGYRELFDNYERQHLFMKTKMLTALEDVKYERFAKLLMERRELATRQGIIAGKMGVMQTYVEELTKILETVERPPFDRHAIELAAAKSAERAEEKRDLMNHSAGVVEYVFNIWKQHNSRPYRDQLKELVEGYIKHAYDMGALQGGYVEGVELMQALDKLLQAAGGEKSIAPLMAAQNG